MVGAGEAVEAFLLLWLQMHPPVASEAENGTVVWVPAGVRCCLIDLVRKVSFAGRVRYLR